MHGYYIRLLQAWKWKTFDNSGVFSIEHFSFSIHYGGQKCQNQVGMHVHILYSQGEKTDCFDSVFEVYFYYVHKTNSSRRGTADAEIEIPYAENPELWKILMFYIWSRLWLLHLFSGTLPHTFCLFSLFD